MPETTAPSPVGVSLAEFGRYCVAAAPAGLSPESDWEALCLGAVEAMGVPVTDDLKERLSALIEEHRASPNEPHKAVIAEGTPPVHGVNGRLEILPQFDPEQIKARKQAEAEAEEDGVVDHRERSAFVLIQEGEQIGTLHLPGFGEDGESVLGSPIVAKNGKAVILNTDDSVIVRESGKIEAAFSGVVRIDGKKIRVLRRLDIHGQVDFSTGNIDFPGDVVVDEGVKDQFKVVAQKDILIKGLVEAATLNAGRDLHLLGGAACREKGELRAGRDISARYLNECVLRSGRHLAVTKEIINADLTVGGALISPNCTLIGGTTRVTGKCELEQIGSERNVATRLVLGGQPEAEDLTVEASVMLQEISDRIRESEQERQRLMEQGAAASEELSDHVADLEIAIGGFNRLEDRLTNAVDGMHSAVAAVAVVDLRVHKLLWRGVRIVFPSCEATIENPLKGPLQISCVKGEPPILKDLMTNSSVELSTVADVRSRMEDQGADEALAA